ncbi:MAG TPA: hypothetical protein VGH52_07660 [Gaiellaceae bacterium]|jgi:hypothetical protein
MPTYRERAELSANRLERVQLEDGRFLYSVHPDRGIERRDNLVRQAGCAYALAFASRREAAARTLRFLSDNARTSVSGDLFVPEPGRTRGKLGVVALAALAGLSEMEPTLRQAQRPDGSFRCWLGDGPLPRDGTKADYYPGQTLLALARGGEHDVVARSFDWSRGRFRSAPSPAFVGWQALAWTAEAEHLPEAPAFVFELVDWLLQFQLTRRWRSREHDGGFSFGTAPGSSSLVYAEAVLAGLNTAHVAGDVKREARYAHAARNALAFCARLQLLEGPEDCCGGFTRSLTDAEMRCDNDQHAITAFLTAAELLQS